MGPREALGCPEAQVGLVLISAGLPGWEVMESQGSQHERLVILYGTLPRLLPTAHQSSFRQLLTCVTAIVCQQAGMAGILRRMGLSRI